MDEYIFCALSGDHSAFEQLYNNFAPAALRLGVAITRNPALAEDAVQEAFVRVFKKGYQCKKERKFEPWFFRIVINESKRVLKKNPGEQELDTERFGSSFTDQTDLSLAITAALDKLSSEHRTILVLMYLMGYGEKDISEILKKPVGTVKSRIHYAKKALAKEIEIKGEELL